MSNPSVTALIVSYHTGPLLFRCLASVLEQAGAREIILIDNGNPEEVLARLHEIAGIDPRLRILSGHGNIGFAAACNKGAEAASGTHLLILNPDAQLPPGGLPTLCTELGHAEGEMKLIGGRLVGPDGFEQAGSRRAVLTPWTALVEILRLDRLAPKHPYFRRLNHHTDPLPEQTIPVPTISGACMLLSREDYFAISGMDEHYFLHVEDVDFCLRFREAGGEVYFCPAVDILHEKGSSRTSRVRVERLKAQSLTRYFRRHFPDQYPPGFVSLVCGLVWLGFAGRAARSRVTSFFRSLGQKAGTARAAD
ncbi:glycosyltransferase family 2 protein [Parvularcula marina]|uniref:glycosyltransferase family 2 protein n=1 Tax=Parvularcula marina TaxID=2292771 RepID=UPI003511A0EE